MCLSKLGQPRASEEDNNSRNNNNNNNNNDDGNSRERHPSSTDNNFHLNSAHSARISVEEMEAAAAKLNANNSTSVATPSSVDYTPRSSPPSSLNRSPPLSAAPPVSPPSRSGAGASPPPTLIPSSGLSMVSMASMLGGHPPPFLMSHAGLAGYPRDLMGRSPADDFAANMHKFMDRSFGDSPPPPTVPTNDPTANECKIVDYRGEKIAAFTINGKTMLCLPQAFELFLKHLVGGLHTVYTKLKRLEITPIVCNVEQVRILRGLGAIQPGVNRCKLLADTDFDALYKDCTTSSSRPGRPPKRGVPFPPMSPQDAMLHLKQTMQHNGAGVGAAGHDPFGKDPYGKEPRLDKSPFGNGFGPPGPPGLNPMAAQFMALNHPAAAQAAQAAFLSQTAGAGGLPPPFAAAAAAGLPAVSSSPNIPGRPEPQQFMKNAGLPSLEALQRSGLFGAAYLERMREGQRNLDAERERDRERSSAAANNEHSAEKRQRRDSSQDSGGRDERGGDSPILNLTKPVGSSLGNTSSSSSTGGHHALGLGHGELVRGPGSESPLSDLAATPKRGLAGLGVKDHEDLSEDDLSDDDKEGDVKIDSSEKKADKFNNNKQSLEATALATSMGLPPGFGLPGMGDGEGAGAAGQLNSVYGLIGNIQALLKMAVDNAKKEERNSILSQKSEHKTDSLSRPNDSSLQQEMEELKKSTQLYLRRFKKEKRFRRKLQEQLELETKRREQMEEALRLTSAETLKRITESLHKEMEEKKKAAEEREENGSGKKDDGSAGGDDKEVDDDDEDGKSSAASEDKEEKEKKQEFSAKVSAASEGNKASPTREIEVSYKAGKK